MWQSNHKKSQSILENRKLKNLLILLFPATIWLLFFFIIPLIIVFVYSFLERGTYGGVVWQFTLDNYQRLTQGIYWEIFWQSLFLALFTTIICLLIGYPLAFFIATQKPPWRNVLLMLVIIPFWTNFLVRTYAWIVLLRTQGVFNTVLQNLQLIDEPLTLIFTPFAVTVGLVYGYLPFMVLPLYAAIEDLDFSLLEAAQDLGANDLRTFFRVVLPLTMRGIISGALLVFIPAFGAFITPDILGGAKTMMIGNLIQNQFIKARNWPFGSALSILLMVIVLIPVIVYFQISKEQKNTL